MSGHADERNTKVTDSRLVVNPGQERWRGMGISRDLSGLVCPEG